MTVIVTKLPECHRKRFCPRTWKSWTYHLHRLLRVAHTRSWLGVVVDRALAELFENRDHNCGGRIVPDPNLDTSTFSLLGRNKRKEEKALLLRPRK